MHFPLLRYNAHNALFAHTPSQLMIFNFCFGRCDARPVRTNGRLAIARYSGVAPGLEPCCVLRRPGSGVTRLTRAR